MPLIETQPDALARLYARSLFELAEQEGGRGRIEEIGAELGEVVELARSDRRFGEFLSSRIVASSDRARSLEKIFRGNISELLLRFLLVLAGKDRLGHLAVVASAYDERVQEAFGLVEVDVYTATPIDQAMRDRIGSALQRAIGKEPVLHAYTDESMLGGIKVRVGDQLMDASVATRLRRLRERLSVDGAARLRGKLDSMIDRMGQA